MFTIKTKGAWKGNLEFLDLGLATIGLDLVCLSWISCLMFKVVSQIQLRVKVENRSRKHCYKRIGGNTKDR